MFDDKNIALYGGQPDEAKKKLADAQWQLPTGSLTWLGEGIVAFKALSGNKTVILSAGFHGDETGPVTLLNSMLNDLVNGELQPEKNCLFIIGNPLAVAKGVHSIDQSLKHLFSPKTDPASHAIALNHESKRAAEIMSAVSAFARRSSGISHYDLQSTHYPSKMKTFALCPNSPANLIPEPQLAFLARSGVQAIVIQNEVDATFSSWTSRQFGAESFMLIFDETSPFGQDQAELTPSIRVELKRFLEAEGGLTSLRPSFAGYPQQFTVVHEITNSGSGFYLTIPENTPNFSQFQPGDKIWHDDSETYQVSDDTAYIVFPRSRTREGERAGLLVRNHGTVLV